MGKNLIAVGLLVTMGCTTTATVISEDPTRIHVTCRRALGNCYERANEECPNGFTVIDGTGHEGAVVSMIGSTAIATPTYDGELIVECK